MISPLLSEKHIMTYSDVVYANDYIVILRLSVLITLVVDYDHTSNLTILAILSYISFKGRQ